MKMSFKMNDTIFCITVGCITVAGALFYLWQGYLVMTTKWEISALESKYEQLFRNGDKLKQQLAELSDLSQLAEEAKSLGFVEPEPSDVLTQSAPELVSGGDGSNAH